MQEMRDQAKLKTVQPQNFPAYEPPRVISYHEEEILEMLGPAQACSYYGSVLECGAAPPFSRRLPFVGP